MNGRKTLYIHIGTPKTGTTAIQGFCQDNAEELARHGYCFPDFTWLCPDFRSVRNGHFLVESVKDADGRVCAEAERQIFCRGMERIAELFRTYEAVILSDEGIWMATFERRKSLWRELAAGREEAGFQVKIIVYLRRQDGYLSSSWNQVVKMGVEQNAVRSWDEYTAHIPKIRQLNYDKKLGTIAAALGKDNLIVRRYEPGHFCGGSIYADFLDAAGLTLTDAYVINKEVRNVRLAGNLHEIKRILNGMKGLGEEERRFLRITLVKCAQEPDIQRKYSMFSVEETAEFLEKYREGNRRVAKEYLGEPDADLFDMDIPDLPRWRRESTLMEDDIIRFAGQGFAEMHAENERLRQELADLKEKLRHPLRTVWHKLWSRFAENE